MTGGGDGCAWARASLGEELEGTTCSQSIRHTRHWPLSQWRARSAVDPPRSIPNRVVKRGSAEGTGGMSAGRVGPCAILARRGAVAARRAHNPKVDGSNPSAATNSKPPAQQLFRLLNWRFYVSACVPAPNSIIIYWMWAGSSVVEQRPFKPSVVGSIPTRPTRDAHLRRRGRER